MSESTSAWYFVQSKERSGPHPLEHLQQLVTAGMIIPATMVWTEGMPQWVAARTIVALFAGGTPPPLPAVPIGYAQVYPAPPGIGNDPTMRMLLPVGRSGWAIAAGYAGLFAVLVIFAPIALILGIVALVHLKRRPDLHGKGRAIFGIVMGSLFSLLLGFMLFALW